MSPNPNPKPFALPLPETTPSPLLPGANIIARQASIVTQTVIASTGISAPSGSSSTGSSGSSFPVAVAVPALIGGMALALLGALGWWFFQRRRTRERKRRWEARQKRQNKKRGNSNATPRPSISGSRPVVGRAGTSGLSEKKDDHFAGGAGIPPVPPLPTLGKEYGYGGPPQDGNGYNYGQPQQQAQGYDQYNPNQYDQHQQQQQQYSTQPHIDSYGQDNSDPFNPEYEQHEHELEETNSTVPAPAPAPGTKSSGRGAKRIELAENAVAREHADPMTRWRPNKPSPLALAAEKARLEANGGGASSLSPARYSKTSSTGAGGEPPHSAAGESSWEYQEELTTPNDPDYVNRRSEDMSGGGAGARQVSGEWGIAGGGGSPNVHGSPNVQQGRAEGGRYTNDPYLSQASRGKDDDGYRAPSGQYTVDPYAIYHGGGAPGGGGGMEMGTKQTKIGGWV